MNVAEKIATRCPACGHQTLFIGSGGWLTCSWLQCPNPAIMNDLIPKHGTVLNEVDSELERATSIHGPMNSAHEGYAVLKEEVDELWDVVKTNTHGDPNAKLAKRKRLREEAIQVAAMAIRFVNDVCDKK